MKILPYLFAPHDSFADVAPLIWKRICFFLDFRQWFVFNVVKHLMLTNKASDATHLNKLIKFNNFLIFRLLTFVCLRLHIKPSDEMFRLMNNFIRRDVSSNTHHFFKRNVSSDICHFFRQNISFDTYQTQFFFKDLFVW